MALSFRDMPWLGLRAGGQQSFPAEMERSTVANTFLISSFLESEACGRVQALLPAVIYHGRLYWICVVLALFGGHHRCKTSAACLQQMAGIEVVNDM